MVKLPSALSNKPNVPSTWFSSKYFFKESSTSTLLLEQETANSASIQIETRAENRIVKFAQRYARAKFHKVRLRRFTKETLRSQRKGSSGLQNLSSLLSREE